MSRIFTKFLSCYIGLILAVVSVSASAYQLSPESFNNFYAAASEGDVQTIVSAQHRGLDINSTNANGDTALCVAIKRNDYLAYRTLVRLGAATNPECVDNIPSYAHKSFLNDYNSHYRITTRTESTGWGKKGAALVLGAGAAAGVVALLSSGGGGGHHSSDDNSTCKQNKCAEGCYTNVTCSIGQQCAQTNECGGCDRCETAKECAENKCAEGCYTNIECGASERCVSTNSCGGCERCSTRNECILNRCAKGCFENITCKSNETCSARNDCGGCTACTAKDQPIITIPIDNCEVYNSDNELCYACSDQFMLIAGHKACMSIDKKIEHCADYNLNEKCTGCVAGYQLVNGTDGEQKCIDAIDNCVVYNIDGSCRECASGYAPISGSGCVQTVVVNHCLEYNSTHTACTLCESGFNLIDDGQTCSQDNSVNIPNCKTYNTAHTLCMECNDNYTLSADRKTCTYSGSGITINGCETYNETHTLCTKCYSGYNLSADGLSCTQQSSDCSGYPLSSCPLYGNCTSCTSGSITTYKLTSCTNGYNVSADGLSCVENTTTDCSGYPLTYCPANGNCSSCNNGSTTTYRLTSCTNGYNVSADGLSCVENTSDQCSGYSLTTCPGSGNCSSCNDSSGTHYKLDSCQNNSSKNSDETSCVCNTNTYSSTTCPENSSCDICIGSDNVSYYKFSCLPSFIQSSSGCVENHNTNNIVANDDYITILDNTVNPQSTDSLYKYADDKIKIAFTTDDTQDIKSDIYNSYEQEAEINVYDSSTDRSIYGLASRPGGTGNLYNVGQGNIGTINLKKGIGIYGITGNPNVYNAYSGYGNIKVTDGIGIFAINNAVNAYNDGSGKIEVTKGYGIISENSLVINAYNGGNGTINIGSGDTSGTGMVGVDIYNALSSNRANTAGTITITGNGTGIHSGIFSKGQDGNYYIANSNGGYTYYNNFKIHNAYGENATGIINVNGPGRGIEGSVITNGEHGGKGFINIDDKSISDGIIVAILASHNEGINSYNGYDNGEGSIEITTTASHNLVLAMQQANNGSNNGGKGTITINDTGNNDTTAILYGNNYTGSSISITSNAGEGKKLIGINGTPHAFLITSTVPNAPDTYYNLGNIEINGTGKATIYGIVNNTENYDNGTYSAITNNGEITIESMNSTAIYGIRGYKENVTNSGTINITGNKAYGIYFIPTTDEETGQTDVLNSGTIEITNNSNTEDSAIYGIYVASYSAKPLYVNNNQNINLTSSSGSVYGMYINRTHNSSVKNSGTINITTTGNTTAYGLYRYDGTSSNIPLEAPENSSSGKIEITSAAGTAYGVLGFDNNGEIAMTANGGTVYGAQNSVNQSNGKISVNYSGLQSAHGMTASRNFSSTNEGAIAIEATQGNIYGMSTTWEIDSNNLGSAGHIYNHGNIRINKNTTSSNANVYGMYSEGTVAYNETGATIAITPSTTGITYGMYALHISHQFPGGTYNGGGIKNSGTIEISGTTNNVSQNIYGMYAKDGATAENIDRGEIIISASTNGSIYGMYAEGSNGSVRNEGKITINGSAANIYAMYAKDSATLVNKDGEIKINGSNYEEVIIDGSTKYITNSGSSNSPSSVFLYADDNSSIINTGSITSSQNIQTAGKYLATKGSKLSAPAISGVITAAADIATDGFAQEYVSNEALIGDVSAVSIESDSLLFNAALRPNADNENAADIVMTMKSFAEVTPDDDLADYLQINYENQNAEEALFKPLKQATNDNEYRENLYKSLGIKLLPNFAQENFNVFRSLNNLMINNLYATPMSEERMMVGYDFLALSRSGHKGITGYENNANSSYFIGDIPLDKYSRFGLGVSITRFDSDYDDSSDRDETFAKALASYMYDFKNNWTYAGVLHGGYGFGDYKRYVESNKHEADLHEGIYGLNNELRYTYELPYVTLEPQLEMNFNGYYQNRIKEKRKDGAINVKGTNNLSVENGVGLYASKTFNTRKFGDFKGRLGGSYYHEWAHPYHTMKARLYDTDGYYKIHADDIFDRDRFLLEADITYNYKALDLYVRACQYLEKHNTTVFNAGLKWNF